MQCSYLLINKLIFIDVLQDFGEVCKLTASNMLIPVILYLETYCMTNQQQYGQWTLHLILLTRLIIG